MRNYTIFGLFLPILLFFCNSKVIVNAFDAQITQNGDSFKVDFFDADGYYYLEKDIDIDGIKLHGFAIYDSVSYYNNGKLDYDNPIIKEPKVSISLITRNRERKEYYCEESIVTRKKLFLRAEQTLIGDIIIEGKFLNERGQFWNYPLEDEDVVQAKVIILKNEKTIYSSTKLFKYWSGD